MLASLTFVSEFGELSNAFPSNVALENIRVEETGVNPLLFKRPDAYLHRGGIGGYLGC